MSFPHPTTICPKCNYDIPIDSVFCQACGTKLSAATMTTQSDEVLRHMFEQVDKMEFMNFSPVSNSSTPQMTEQQKQEELDRRIQNSRDIAIAKRIALAALERRRKKILTFVILGIFFVTITVFAIKMAV